MDRSTRADIWKKPVEWELHFEKGSVLLDSSARAALSAGPGDTRVSHEHLESMGAKLEGGMSLGQWLLRTGRNGPDAGLHRCIVDEFLLLDSWSHAGTTQVRSQPIATWQREMHHEAQNHLTNIQLNAEMLKLLSSENQDSRLSSIADGILADCAKVSDLGTTLARIARLNLQAPVPAGPVLGLLFRGPQKGSGNTASVRHASLMMAEVLMGCLQLFLRLEECSCAGFRCRLEQDDTLDGSLLAEIDLSRSPVSPADMLNSEWSARAQDGSVIPNWPSSIRAFSIIAKEKGLMVSVNQTEFPLWQ